jgi:hypothetical protein
LTVARPLAIELEQRDVGGLVVADHGRVVGVPGGGDGDLDRGRTLDDVVVREHDPGRVEHQAAAGGLAGGRLGVDQDDTLRLLGGRVGLVAGLVAGAAAELVARDAVPEWVGAAAVLPVAGDLTGVAGLARAGLRLLGSSGGRVGRRLGGAVGEGPADGDRDGGGDDAAGDGAGERGTPAPAGAVGRSGRRVRRDLLGGSGVRVLVGVAVGVVRRGLRGALDRARVVEVGLVVGHGPKFNRGSWEEPCGVPIRIL